MLGLCITVNCRIGRTGRAGLKKGESFSFISRSRKDIWETMGIVEVVQKLLEFVFYIIFSVKI